MTLNRDLREVEAIANEATMRGHRMWLLTQERLYDERLWTNATLGVLCDPEGVECADFLSRLLAKWAGAECALTAPEWRLDLKDEDGTNVYRLRTKGKIIAFVETPEAGEFMRFTGLYDYSVVVPGIGVIEDEAQALIRTILHLDSAGQLREGL